MTRFIAISAAPLLCFFSLSLLSFQTMSHLNHISNFCYRGNFTSTSIYESNRDTVLSDLRKRSSLESYANATAGFSPNTVYGMFLCRGDLNRTSCSDCVQTATLGIHARCPNQKEAFMFYDECMVRYSNFSFFTLLDDIPTFADFSSIIFPQSFKQILPRKVDKLIVRASSLVLIPYFAEDHERLTLLEGLYNLEAMVQCSPDLGPRNCSVCLRQAFYDYFGCCRLRQPSWAQIVTPKCRVKYNISALQTSLGITKGNEIYGRTLIPIMTAAVLLLMGF